MSKNSVSFLLLQILVIVAAGIYVFYPALHGGWLMDDEVYLTHNPLRYDPERLWKIWFQPGSFVEYYPLEETVQYVQWRLWGEHTLGYHLTNVVLHIVSALLVWRLLAKLGLRLAWLGGLLFAIHPVQVESVAWISELKNTLSLPPFLLAMCAWIDYEQGKRPRDYFLALGFFLVAMLAKISMAPFPALILLYAWWKRGRIGRDDLKAAAPFLALSLALVVTTIWAGIWYFQGQAIPQDGAGPGGLFERLARGGVVFALYFFHCFWPVGLAPIYPQWSIDPGAPTTYLPWAILLAAVCWFWWQRKSWGRHALFGIGFFSLMIGPFLGFMWISYMRFTPVMDHFLYIAIIGPIGLFVAALEHFNGMLSRSATPYAIGLVAVVVVLLTVGSRAYATAFGDSLALWTYALRENPDSSVVRISLGEGLAQQGRIPEAMEQFEAAIRIYPSSLNARDDLGKALNQMGRSAEAIDEFETELQVNPSDANASYSLGNIFVRLHQIPEATKWYKRTLQLNPSHFAAHYALGCILLGSNQFPQAINYLQQALQIDPSHAEVHSALGSAFFRTNRVPEAIDQFRLASQLLPGSGGAHCDLGVALARMGRMPEATQEFQAALQINPNDFMAHYDLGSAFLAAGKIPSAIEAFRVTLQLKPDFVPAQKSLDQAGMLEKAEGTTAPSP